jgi:hypothetical protein
MEMAMCYTQCFTVFNPYLGVYQYQCRWVCY